MSVPDEIAARLQALDPVDLAIHDESGNHIGHAGAKDGGGHYWLTIVSDRFAALSPIARHRLVFDTLGDLMQHKIHALSIKALTPDEL